MPAKIPGEVRQRIREFAEENPGLTNQEIADKLNLGLSTVKTTLRRKKFLKMEDRFWFYVDKSAGPDQCWPWKAHRHPEGYGGFFVTEMKRCVPASRVSLFLTTGKWPVYACHKCDNPCCVNPSHLFDGTCKDNVTDMIQKGRKATYSSPGSKNPKAKLNEEDVWQIRTLSHLCLKEDLADCFKVSLDTVSSIQLGRTWRHLL